MTGSGSKLTPAEFLAELKARAPSAPPVEAETPESVDELEFDFSDLDEASDVDEAGDEAPSVDEEPHEPQKSAKNGRADATAQTDLADEGQQQADDASDDGDDDNVEGDDESESAASASDHPPRAVRQYAHLSELFDRVNSLLGGPRGGSDQLFRPKEPQSLEATGLTFEEVERLVLKFLLSKGSALGRVICGQVQLPYTIVDPILRQLKQDQLLAFKGTGEMGDYEFVITDYGRERAQRYNQECTYFGAAPVSLRDYLIAMAEQSIAKQHVTEEDLKRAFSDLIIDQSMLDRLGPAINSGRGMFLFGEPGNGKTSIAERVTSAFGSNIWIPRALGIDGDIIRIFDPGVHEVVDEEQDDGIFDLSGIDQRWVQIVRPTIVAGGELTMSELEVTQNTQTKICEGPLQLKSNCGTLVIDDFGRQTMPVDVLLNRWIVPLEKRYDFLNLPSGKKIQVPFDQLIIFSTNLEPKDLVDDAFLRRIPYKIEVADPTEENFRELMKLMSPMNGFEYDKQAVDYLIETHYRSAGRPFRACQPRDLLLQVKNYCSYKGQPKAMTPEAFDFAVENYFSVM